MNWEAVSAIAEVAGLVAVIPCNQELRVPWPHIDTSLDSKYCAYRDSTLQFSSLFRIPSSSSKSESDSFVRSAASGISEPSLRVC